jgi:hypothetical protein
MQVIIGSFLTVALVLLLVAAVWRPALGRLSELRGATYMLLIGVPALVVQTDFFAIAALAGSSVALLELIVALAAL